MWINGSQDKAASYDLNADFLTNLKGQLEDKECKISLTKFLRHNLGLTAELISGVKLFPFQELMIRSWFQRNYNLVVWGRGGSKSWTVAMFVVLYCIFNPNIRVVLVAQNFRTARRIFEQIQKFVNSKEAILLQQCFSQPPTRRNDGFNYEINGGSILCLPLAGVVNLRGTRADVLIADEFNLIPQEIFESVLMPFLVAKSNIKEQLKIGKIEDRLIAQGKLTEDDRVQFDSGKRIVALSSASYQFEYLYKVYQQWIDKIHNPDKNTKATYFVSQLSYESAPKELIDNSIVEMAKSGGASNAVFKREYCAMFTDDSDSYFSAKKMAACTIADGERPTIEILGQQDAEYILAVDPSFSSSKASDDFAMNLFKINRENKSGTLVHNYAVPGGDLKDHIEYLHYLLTKFNIIYIIVDKAGGEEFTKACNNSGLFINSKLEIKAFDAEFDVDQDYVQAVKRSKLSYNLTAKKIVHVQQFSSQTIRKMNEWLQAAIDHKKVWFASHASAHDVEFAKLISCEVPTVRSKSNGDQEYKEKIIDFIDEQGELIDLTKKECSLIEVKSSPSSGVQSFDLPTHLRKSVKEDKVRKDNYTCLMLANWALRCLFDMETQQADSSDSFKPFFAG